jgi:hypothetical protein
MLHKAGAGLISLLFLPCILSLVQAAIAKKLSILFLEISFILIILINSLPEKLISREE